MKVTTTLITCDACKASLTKVDSHLEVCVKYVVEPPSPLFYDDIPRQFCTLVCMSKFYAATFEAWKGITK